MTERRLQPSRSLPESPQPPSSRGTERRPEDALILAAAVFLLAAFLLVEVYDLDVWWQLAIGRDLLANGAIPGVDRWSILGAGRPYHDSHALFQVALALMHRAAGWIGVQALVVALWSAVFAALWRISRTRLGVPGSAALVLLAGLACLERFLPRPELATYAGFATFLLWFGAGRVRSRGELARLAAAQSLWASSHGLFVLGPFVAATHLGVGLLASRDRMSSARRFAPALLVTGIASLVNPNGIRAWEYALLLFREAGESPAEIIGSLGEMTSPFAALSRNSPAIWIFYLLLGLAFIAAGRKLLRRELDAPLVLAAATAVLALTGRRNVVLFAIGSLPLLAELFAEWPVPRALRRRAVPALAALGLLALAAYPLSGAYYLHMEIPARFGPGVTPSFFPHALAPRLASGRLGRGLLASNSLGGFVSYHGAPRTLPLTDGRWEVQDGDQLSGVLSATRQTGAWRQVVERFGLDGVLLAHTSPEAAAILPEIARDPSWRLAHLDAAASLWLPADAQAGESTVDLSSFSLPDSIRRPEDGILLSVFAARTGSHELERLALERTLAFGKRRAWLLARLGPLQIRSERFGEAERTFRALLELEPASETALNELAFLAYRRGELDQALELLDQLLRVAPDNEEYRQNRKRVAAARESH